MNPVPKQLPKSLIWGVVVICILPFILNLIGISFDTAVPPLILDEAAALDKTQLVDTLHGNLKGSFTHTILEWSAFSVAIFTVILAFSQYRLTGNVTTPVIGVALFWAGAMDAFHTLAADRLMTAVADNTDLIPFTWAVCRMFNALILITGTSILWMQRSRVKTAKIKGNITFVIIVALIFGAIAYGVIHLCAVSESLPQTMFEESLITRPWDVAPLILFILAGTIFYPKHCRKYPGLFSSALLLSVIPAVATQLHMAFGSKALFDNHFNIGHFLKIISYAVPLAGLILDYMGSYRDVNQSNTELTKEISERKKAQKGLATQNAITRVLSEAKTLDEATRKILQIMCEGFRWNLGEIWKYDENDNLLRCIEVWQNPKRDLQEFVTATHKTSFSPGSGLPGRVFRSGQSAWIQDVTKDSDFARATEASKVGLHGALALPITLNGEVLWVFEFFSSDCREEDEDLVELAEIIGHQLSLFIERKQAQQMSKARARVSTLNGEVGVSLAQGLGQRETLQSCAESVVRRLDAAFARIWILNEAENVLELQASAGLYTHIDGAHSRVPVGKFKIGLIAQEGKPHLTNSVVGDARVVEQDWAKREGMVSFAGYPLIAAGKTLGVIAMFARYPLEDFVRAGLAGIADGIAVCIKGKQEELDLRASEAKLRATVDTAVDGIITIDEFGIVQSFNPAAEKIFGFRSEEIRDQNVARLMPSPYSEEHDSYLAKYMRTGQAHIIGTGREVTGLRMDGSEFPMELSVGEVPLGEERLFTGIVRDITDRKQAEKDLKHALDLAVEAARLKSEFLANMSHEIRTPMNAVIGVTEMLLDDDLTSEQKDSVETINSAGDALMVIINDILDFSKIEAGKLAIDKEEFDLRRTIEETIDVVARRAHAKNIELTLQIHHDVPSAMRGDSGRLRQILTNLAGNAIKFTEKGEVAITITKESETDEKAQIRFSVRDTGMGITQEGQRRLFQSFSQVDGTSTRKFGGTGLGLAISRNLVEAMGGEIGVESAIREGSTFWFVVPLNKQNSQSDPGLKPPKNIRGLRILIVDDNSTNRKILQYQLESFGTRDEAKDGAEGLELITQHAAKGEPYDLAVIDMQMPEKDGITLAKAIKKDPRIASTVLLLLSSSAAITDSASARAAGFAACLSKPIKERQLIEAIETIMSSTDKASDRTSSQNPIPSKQAQPLKEFSPNTRLLVADDDAVNRKVALIQLKKLGLQADFAVNGIEALELLEQNSYDIILMDCQMPEMDGYTAAIEIRRREGNSKHTTIIAMTAHALQGEREKCLDAGMDDYLSKPVKADVLRQMIDRWLSDSSGEKKE